MGIVKISEELHQQIRHSSSVMSRSINAQAEFWIKIGRMAELNPSLNFHQIIQQLHQQTEQPTTELSDE